MIHLDMEGQIKRRNRLFELYREYMGDHIDDNGHWHGREDNMNMRERLWHCLALLEGSSEQIHRANRILELLTLEKCHFAPMNCMQIMLQHENRLTDTVVTKLEAYVRSSIDRQANPKVHFTMYNDNFASMATFTLLAAGERFHDKRAFRAGMERLIQLKERYVRCGVLMEYCSTTYLSITIQCLAQIYTYVNDAQARSMALECEERAWAEAASHYHAPSGRLAGPYSRAYTMDTLGNPSGLYSLLYMVFGDEIFINPVKDMFPYRPGLVVHHGIERLTWPCLIWNCSGLCHCPAYLGEILLHKTYPYTAIARAECLSTLTEGFRMEGTPPQQVPVCNPFEYQGSAGPIYTYMTEDYALGTAYSQYHDGGLSESFYTVYRKKVPASDITGTRAVFCRYILNDRQPETLNKYSVYGEADGSIGFRDEARKFGIQHQDCSLIAYKPKQFESHSMWSMKLSILFPCHFSNVDEIWIGGKKLDGFFGESREPATVFVKDGPVYMAFTPLELTDHGRMAAVRIEKKGSYIMISFYNYEGAPRSFHNKELFLTTNGFITNIKSANDTESFEAFMKYAMEYSLTDITEHADGGYTRWIRYKRIGTDIHFAYSPISEGIMIAAVNGKPRPEPVFQATGINPEQLPFLE